MFACVRVCLTCMHSSTVGQSELKAGGCTHDMHGVVVGVKNFLIVLGVQGRGGPQFSLCKYCMDSIARTASC